MPSIPQTNPKASYLAHQAAIDAAIAQVLTSGWYVLGQEVTAFEQEFAQYVGVSHGLGVANGTDALVIALRTCGIESGDLVITVSHTAVATVAAIELVGAVPLLVDIDPQTYTLDPNALEATLRQSSHSGAPSQGCDPGAFVWTQRRPAQDSGSCPPLWSGGD
ncbi:hypothetical protein DO97_01500 [Neosynechococcus sphagnicola sy1]|uniref:DegT/DnrJ/EryC1/StrS aminotransferase n=1 Tax=Neosynechococcus sphagnicola sy1 TaxID=1497020 RepID=A0A098TQU9_9CYAN|nr:DegT/DnrJ/EryC1/StrS family aminotransferase [Neosynechococcus sphagnicola]KGF73208.1 hypothetical protein DO97_01500 [Neosynechococcus sphagnicola sy1]